MCLCIVDPHPPQGLLLCPLKDALLVKALKLTERIGSPNLARKLLAQLQHAPPDKNWKIFLEGAALEARCGYQSGSDDGNGNGRRSNGSGGGLQSNLQSNGRGGGLQSHGNHTASESDHHGRDETEADGNGNHIGSRDHVCRAIFAYLMRHASWFGPIYHDAAKFEERRERPAAALQVMPRTLIVLCVKGQMRQNMSD